MHVLVEQGKHIPDIHEEILLMLISAFGIDIRNNFESGRVSWTHAKVNRRLADGTTQRLITDREVLIILEGSESEVFRCAIRNDDFSQAVTDQECIKILFYYNGVTTDITVCDLDNRHGICVGTGLDMTECLLDPSLVAQKPGTTITMITPIAEFFSILIDVWYMSTGRSRKCSQFNLLCWKSHPLPDWFPEGILYKP